jgi:phosphate transport system protein
MTDPAPHTIHRYDAELGNLRALIARMGEIAEGQVAGATRALLARDARQAAEVAAGDAELDRLEEAIEAQAIKVLALRHPVASDLRLVVGALKAAGDLERVGDYAANAAKRCAVLASQPPVGSLNGFERLSALVIRNLHEAVGALVSGDAEAARRAWRADEPADAIYTGIFREMLTHMMEDPRTITAATHLLFVAKNLERIGDHATNIAEIAHYLACGERLAGERPKADMTAEAEPQPGTG